MTSRDLVQQRKMLPNGDTIWRHAELVEAALNGGLAVLEGLQRIHHSILNAIFRWKPVFNKNDAEFVEILNIYLYSLIIDREIELFDGSRLLRRDRYDEIMKSCNFSVEDMHKRCSMFHIYIFKNKLFVNTMVHIYKSYLLMKNKFIYHWY